MSNKKAYLIHFLAMLILGISCFIGSSRAAPALQRRNDGDGLSDPTTTSLLDAAGSLQNGLNNATPTMTPTPIPTQGPPDGGNTTSSMVSSSVTPTPTVELVPPVTVLSQFGTTAIVVASQGTTSTILIPTMSGSGTSGSPSPTGSSSQIMTSDGVALRISSSIIAAGLAFAVLIVF